MYFNDVPLPHNVDIENLYCLSGDQSILPNKYQNLNITGRFDSKEQGKLTISIDRCNEDCQSDEKIDSFLKKANVAVYFVNYGLDLKNYKKPFKKHLMGLFTSIDAYFSKTNEIFMKRAKVVSHSGMMLKSKTEREYVLMDSQRETVSSRREQNLYKLELQMSSSSDLHERKYRRLSAVIAEIGGYIKAFLLLAYLFRPFLIRKYYIELINHLYKVDGGDTLKEKPEKFEDSEDEFEDKVESEPASGLISWKKFDFFNFKKKKEKSEKSELKNLDDINDLNDLSSLKENDLSGQENSIKDIPINIPKSEEEENTLIDISAIETDETFEEEQRLVYSLTDWFSVIFPFIKGENETLYKKVIHFL